MSLPLLARLTFIGLVCIYAAKVVDTFFPGIFRPAALAGTVVGLNIAAGLVQLVFFIALRPRLAAEGHPALSLAGWLAVAGSVVALVPKLLALALIIQAGFMMPLLSRGAPLAAFSPWLASSLLFIFCLIGLGAPGAGSRPLPAFALTGGAMGWGVMMLAQSLVLFNFLTAGRLVWLAGLFSGGPWVFVSAATVSLIGLAFFYLSLSRANAS